MGFNTDKQTLDDLNIIGKRGQPSIFTMFNRTSTRGGADLLEGIFLNPLADLEAIKERIDIIEFFQNTGFAFPFQGSDLDTVEQYMAETDERSGLFNDGNELRRRVSAFIGGDTDHQNIKAGVLATLALIKALRGMLQSETILKLPELLKRELVESLQSLDRAGFDFAPADDARYSPSFEELSERDQFLRFQARKEIYRLLHWVHRLDVFLAVANVATAYHLTLPVPLPRHENRLLLDGVFHPQLNNPTANTISIQPDRSVVFLTGANMAGKSTFMKSIGIAFYLAHMGFPVPATKLEFSVRDGIYTTINLPDDLSSGNSHFYAEVLRVKKIAKEIAGHKSLLVIFDELFRGTNVRDAYEGTIALTAAFAGRASCAFVVSTHIIEAGEVLKKRCDNINFVYLPTLMEGNKPVYTYQLQNGITADRHGMVIINNERILEILGGGKLKNINA